MWRCWRPRRSGWACRCRALPDEAKRRTWSSKRAGVRRWQRHQAASAHRTAQVWVRPSSRSSAIPSRNSGVAVWSAWFRKPAFSQEALRDGPGFPPPAPAAQPRRVPVADPVGGQGGRQRIGVEPRVGARAGHRPDIRLTGTGSAPSALPAGAATRRSAAHQAWWQARLAREPATAASTGVMGTAVAAVGDGSTVAGRSAQTADPARDRGDCGSPD
jgi:hypothetical protein